MNHPERNLQIAVVNYIRAQYPHCRVHHSPNGEKRNATTGALLKRMGVSAGFPDLIIYPSPNIREEAMEVQMEEVSQRIGVRPLHLELKTKKGEVNDNQKEWHDWLAFNGHKIEVAYGFDEAKAIIDEYLK